MLNLGGKSGGEKKVKKSGTFGHHCTRLKWLSARPIWQVYNDRFYVCPDVLVCCVVLYFGGLIFVCCDMCRCNWNGIYFLTSTWNRSSRLVGWCTSCFVLWSVCLFVCDEYCYGAFRCDRKRVCNHHVCVLVGTPVLCVFKFLFDGMYLVKYSMCCLFCWIKVPCRKWYRTEFAHLLDGMADKNKSIILAAVAAVAVCWKYNRT